MNLEAPIDLTITDVTTEGAGIGRTADGLVVFVPGAVPGDRVRAQVVKQARGHAEADLLSIETPARERVAPPCPVQARCGGCPLMTLDAETALNVKSRHLVETLRRVGNVALAPERVLASPAPLRYRGRVRFAVAPRREGALIGFRPRGDHGALVVVDDCLVAPEDAALLARTFIAQLARADGGDACWPTHITVRSSHATRRHLLVIHTPPGRWPEAASAARALVEEEPAIAGIVRVVERGSRAIAEHVLAGDGFVEERILGIDVPVRATAFLQVNPSAAALLYEEVRACLEGRPRASVLDLYCGAGLAGLTATDATSALLGVESDAHAIEAARTIATRLGRPRAEFANADARTAATTLARARARFDVVIINPPRAGAGADIPVGVRALRVPLVVLVSCHPATLARDARAFIESGYAPVRLAAVDLFPQTTHLEAVLALERAP